MLRPDLTIRASLKLPIATLALAATLSWSTGCQQLTTYNLALNPLGAGSVPEYKTQYGLTPKQKIERLEHLAMSAGSLTDEEQQSKSQELLQVFEQEPDPSIRLALTGALAAMKGPLVPQGLRKAAGDPNAAVRIAAAEAWSGRESEESLAVLADLLEPDEDADVRQAACQAIARFQEPKARELLASMLIDRDPALRTTVLSALQTQTGKDLGPDAAAWQQYLGTLSSEQPPISGPEQ